MRLYLFLLFSGGWAVSNTGKEGLQRRCKMLRFMPSRKISFCSEKPGNRQQLQRSSAYFSLEQYVRQHRDSQPCFSSLDQCCGIHTRPQRLQRHAVQQKKTVQGVANRAAAFRSSRRSLANPSESQAAPPENNSLGRRPPLMYTRKRFQSQSSPCGRAPPVKPDRFSPVLNSSVT